MLARGLSTPLTLTLLRDTYQAGDDVGKLLGATRSTEAIERHLIARVLPAAYTPRPGRPAPRYSEEQARQTLTCIARKMGKERDLAWWRIPHWVPATPRILTTGLVYGIGIGLGNVLTLKTVSGLMVRVGDGLMSRPGDGPAAWLVYWLVSGPMVGLVVGLGFIFGLVFSRGVKLGVAAGLGAVFVFVFVFEGRVVPTLVAGLGLGLGVGLAYRVRTGSVAGSLDGSGLPAGVSPSRVRLCGKGSWSAPRVDS